MIDHYAVRFLLSAESLAYMLAAWSWWRVWRQPTVSRISLAAFYTGVCCVIKVVRIAAMIVSRNV